jgi:hypothetical protein
MKMEKIFKLTKPLYRDCDCLLVSCEQKTGWGYVIDVDPIHYNEDIKCYGTVFCSEYFMSFAYDMNILAVPCKRRGKKKEAEARKIFEEGAMNYACKYLEYVNKGNLIEGMKEIV